MHAKYEVPISDGSKVIAKVKVDNRQTNKHIDRQTNKQTGQKQYAPDHSIRGHKNTELNAIFPKRELLFVGNWVYIISMTSQNRY